MWAVWAEGLFRSRLSKKSKSDRPKHKAGAGWTPQDRTSVDCAETAMQCWFRTLFRTFRTCSERSERSERSEQSHVPNNLPNNVPYNVECQQSACLVRMIRVEDQHAQAQHWLMHAQAQAQHWFMHAQARAQQWFMHAQAQAQLQRKRCLLYTSPSPRDLSTSRMPSSA